MRTRRLVLKERDWAGASGFASERGWPEQPVEDSGTGRKSRIWTVDEDAGFVGEDSVSVGEDVVFQVSRDRDSGEFCYFFAGSHHLFAGSHHDELVRLIEEAERALDVWQIAELLGEPYEETNPRRLAQSIFPLGLGAPPVNTAEFMPPLAFAMAHAQPIVRSAAARTTAYMEWPELVPILEVMAEHDVDERVRAEARKIVSVYRAVLG
jgi:hypothetical protein